MVRKVIAVKEKYVNSRFWLRSGTQNSNKRNQIIHKGYGRRQV